MKSSVWAILAAHGKESIWVFLSYYIEGRFFSFNWQKNSFKHCNICTRNWFFGSNRLTPKISIWVQKKDHLYRLTVHRTGSVTLSLNKWICNHKYKYKYVLNACLCVLINIDPNCYIGEYLSRITYFSYQYKILKSFN